MSIQRVDDNKVMYVCNSFWTIILGQININTSFRLDRFGLRLMQIDYIFPMGSFLTRYWPFFIQPMVSMSVKRKGSNHVVQLSEMFRAFSHSSLQSRAFSFEPSVNCYKFAKTSQRSFISYLLKFVSKSTFKKLRNLHWLANLLRVQFVITFFLT